jgi:DNA-binding transcriptional regulator of glucitol operon
LEKKGGGVMAKWIINVVLLAIALVACLAAYIQMNRYHTTYSDLGYVQVFDSLSAKAKIVTVKTIKQPRG